MFCPFLTTIDSESQNIQECRKSECEIFDAIKNRCSISSLNILLNEFYQALDSRFLETGKNIVNQLSPEISKISEPLRILQTNLITIQKAINLSNENLQSINNIIKELQDITGKLSTIKEADEKSTIEVVQLLRNNIQIFKDFIEARDKERKNIEELSVAIKNSNEQIIKFFEEQKAKEEQLSKQQRIQEARECNNRGVAHFHRKAYQLAQMEFERAIEIDPTLVEAYNNLGLTFGELNEHQKAIECFKKALDLNPKFAEVYNNLGYIYHLQSNYVEAIEMFDSAIKHNFNSSVAYNNLGKAYLEMENYESAVKSWEKALELDPTNESAKENLKKYGQFKV